MPQGRLYVIAAPSGAGKTSLVKALMEREPRIQFSVSYTTRKARPNEIPGRDYHFVSMERFAEMVAHGEFLEHAQVFDNCYGTGVRAVDEALAIGEQLLLEMDWQGAARDIAHWSEFDYAVINDRFEQALDGLLAIVEDRGSHLIAQRPEVVRLA